MIGKWLAVSPGSRLYRVFVRLLGVPDFHTHLRLAHLQRCTAGVSRFCELGCGSGISLIELLLRDREATAIGFEVDATALGQATGLAERLHLQDRLALRQLDVTAAVPGEIRTAECVLLLDVLEHLRNGEQTAAAIGAAIKVGARVLVSVPTPLYPKIFGKAYHESIGHLRDGFTLGQLDRLFGSLERVAHYYSTGPLSWPGVMLCYRWGWRFRPGNERSKLSRVIAWAAVILATPFRFVDLWNGKSVSCSLFAAYRRRSPAGGNDGSRLSAGGTRRPAQ